MPRLPKGEPVATYETYDEAQKAVVTLAEADFPVTQVSIVGNELTSVERVTGKLTSARAAAAGAASGAWLGLFLGLVTFLFSPVPNISSVIGAVIIGVGFGAIFGIVSYSITRRRRDFTSVMQVTATSYSVVVEPDSMHRARDVLGIGGVGTSVYGEPVVTTPPPAAAPASRPAGPYGERLPEGAGPEAPEPTAPPTSTDRPVGEQGAQGV
ncbi:general stress protein [Clavibacter sp. MX14-G9D]|uniref:general stress protein n=1 Tax=Clavibacter sp. MX14-G9D TaxID=3064656 RepID=UPI00293EC790|nr:general stress protein [Clavibacter sp. MX14-G9D]